MDRASAMAARCSLTAAADSWREAHGDKVGAGAREAGGFLRRLHVEGDAGHLEDLRPPGDELVAAGAALVAVAEMGRRAEGDVVGAGLGQRHGIVTRDAGIDADDGARTEDAARRLVGVDDVGGALQMHAVGSEGPRQRRIADNEGGRVAFLRQLDQGTRVLRLEPRRRAGDDEHGCDVRHPQTRRTAALSRRRRPRPRHRAGSSVQRWSRNARCSRR